MAYSGRHKHQAVIAAIILFITSLFLVVYSSRHPHVARVGVALAGAALAPFQQLTSATLNLVFAGGNKYRELLFASDENEILRQRLDVLRNENENFRALKHENSELRGLLEMKRATELKGVVANVIAYSPSNWAQVITIDQGQAHGVAPEMPVVNAQGVVGQVIAAFMGSAQVLLVTDQRNGIDALIERNRSRGVVSGAERSLANFEFVLVQDELLIGDRVITSGMDGVYPKGLLVGVVSYLGTKSKRGLFREIRIKPAVDFNKLDHVLVVTNRPVDATAEESAVKRGGA